LAEPPVWRQDRVRLGNGVLVGALGTGAKIRGRRNRAERPSLIIVDDPENDEHVTSALQRERSWSWFTRAVANAGTPATNIVVLGTALHRDCLVLRLARAGGWQFHLFKAVVSWPERMDLWKQWELIYCDWQDPERETAARAYYDANRKAMDADAEVLWPEHEDLYELMSLRVTIGEAAFAAEKQGDPFDPSKCEWPPDYFAGPGFWFETWPDRLDIRTLALDPSKGKDASVGDFSALVRLGRDRNGVLYVEADLKRRPMPQIVADAVEEVRLFKPHAFLLEVNQFQELFAAEMARVAAAQGVPLPVVPVENTVNKQVRIRRLGPYLSQRQFRFKSRSPGTALLVQQLQDFPLADFDDGPDGLEMALRGAIDFWVGMQSRGPRRLVP
jgi:predicted phage terminase large subunit-like protein